MENNALPAFMNSAPSMVEANTAELPQHTTKRCCDCNCDCGHSLVNTFSEIVNEKVAPLYDMLNRVENLLISVVNIKYPEIKRKLGSNPPVTSELAPPDPNDDEDDTPKKRRRIYSHHISNKINTTLEPYFEENWKITKEREREIGHKLADEIGLEKNEGINIVKSFWHRSRGNSKRLYTQLDDYRRGCDFILQLQPDKKQDALNYFKIESEDVLRTDIIEVERILDDMAKKGSGRTAVKGKVKNLKPLPDQPIKTVKGRAAALCNHFYQMVESQSLETLPLLEDSHTHTLEGGSPPQHHPLSLTHTHTHTHTHPHHVPHPHHHLPSPPGHGGHGHGGHLPSPGGHHLSSSGGHLSSPGHSHHMSLLPPSLAQSHHSGIPQLGDLGLAPITLAAPLRLTSE